MSLTIQENIKFVESFGFLIYSMIDFETIVAVAEIHPVERAMIYWPMLTA